MNLDIKTPSDPLVRKWMGEIELAREREKDWRKDAREYQDIYEGKKADKTPFNILFSNTETLAPALYARIPRPMTERRFKDADPLGKAVAQTVNRSLEFLIDTDGGEYQPFHEGMKFAVLDALVPGRGVTRFRYDADEDAAEEPHGGEGELVCTESVEWERFYFGYAKKWCDVPWVGFEHYYDKKTVAKNFGKAIASKIKYSVQGADKEEERQRQSGDPAKTSRKTATFYEIWDKDSFSVKWVCPEYPDGLVREDPDPLRLSGFFPCPQPLRLVEKANDLEPTAPYALYANQARELNKITIRLNRLIEACKVRGIYNGLLQEIEEVLKVEENGLVAAQNAAAMEGGLEKNIWLMPTEKIVVTITQLFAARQQCKQVIYEITGISDIMRGQSQASETLGAQEIKQNWGTMRLKRMQTVVHEYVCDCLKIIMEIVCKHFQERTLVAITELPFPTTEQVQQAQMLVKATQQMAAYGIPPSPQAQQAQQVLQGVTWPQIMEILASDQMRSYRVNIETNSTLEPEATEDKEQIAEVMNAISQFLNGIAPMVENGSMPFEVAKEMLLVIVRRFRFGPKIEDVLEKMQAPQPKADPNAQAKMEAEKLKAQLQQQQHQQDMELSRQEMEFKKEEHRLRMMELAAKIQAQEQMGQIKLVQTQQQGAIKAQQAAQQMQQGEQAHAVALDQQAREGDARIDMQERQFQQKSRQERSRNRNKKREKVD